jgi:hypothetical protein
MAIPETPLPTQDSGPPRGRESSHQDPAARQSLKHVPKE